MNADSDTNVATINAHTYADSDSDNSTIVDVEVVAPPPPKRAAAILASAAIKRQTHKRPRGRATGA